MAHERAIDEQVFISLIHNHVNNKTPSGIKIINAFVPPYTLCSTIESGATRSTHHDLKVELVDTSLIVTSVKEEQAEKIIKNVEFKGSKHFKAIDPTKQPWTNGVQFYNGPGNKFTIGRTYARQFYDTMLDELIAQYDIKSIKPSYEIWSKDAFRQGKPKSAFVCELREKGYLSDHLSDIRKKFNRTFVVSAIDLIILLTEVEKIANEVLDCKDYWLQIHGDIETPETFHVRWSNKTAPLKIQEVEQIISKSDADINFKFVCEDGSEFTAKMRWGYGQCITNIRIDIK
jgi:hypothetical protein